LDDLTPLALPAIKVFAFKANKRYDYHNNHLTTKRFNRLTRSEVNKQYPMDVPKCRFFSQEGCFGRVYRLFGNKTNVIFDVLNERLVA